MPRGVEARPTYELLDHGRHVEGHAEGDTPLAALPATDSCRGVAADLEEVREGEEVTWMQEYSVGVMGKVGVCRVCVGSTGRKVSRLAHCGSRQPRRT